MHRNLLLVASSLSLLAASPAQAQSAASWVAWGARLGKPVNACPTAAVPPAQNATNPWFDFNGAFAIPGFSCQQIGSFPSLNTPHGPWFMQNVKGLRPPACLTFHPYCRANSVRMCSVKAIGRTNLTGPFGGTVGPKGCEKLWDEEYTSAVP